MPRKRFLSAYVVTLAGKSYLREEKLLQEALAAFDAAHGSPTFLVADLTQATAVTVAQLREAFENDR